MTSTSPVAADQVAGAAEEPDTAVPSPSPAPESPAAEDTDAIATGLAQVVASRFTPDLAALPVVRGASLLRGVDELKAFYESRGWQPAWLQADELSESAAVLLRILEQAEAEGLQPKDYHIQEIKALLNSPARHDTATRSLLQADMDLLLTDAYRAYAAHLFWGKMEPGRFSDQWPIHKPYEPHMPPLTDIPRAEELEAALQNLLPTAAEYRRLRELLARYRHIRDAGGWPFIPKGKLERGQRDARVALLQKRLLLSGELKELPARHRELFDASLERAVRFFQRAHNLQEDGVVGPATLRLLNIPVEDRITQIRLNMERWRWMPRTLDRHILVNIPSFELKVLERDQAVLKMRTIVGKEANPTPSFTERLSQIEINPLWNVPRSIVEKEIIPKVKTDPSYLTLQGLRIYRDWRPDAPEIPPTEIDWEKMTPKKFPYRLVQDAGPLNPLGRIKFLFPNKHDVYMHDTPSRHLFQRKGRTFSHGCIRIEKPVELAEYLLKGETGWGRKQIHEEIRSGQRHVIFLREKIPVHIVYFTVWTGEGGLVYFRDDLYEYDRQLDTAMRPHPGKAGGFLF